MEAEYVSLSMIMKELLPIILLVKGVAKYIGLSAEVTTSIHIAVHEDIAGCLVLAKTKPPWMTSQRQNYCKKYRWFQEKLKPNNIQLYNIDSEKKLGEICEKGLRRDPFEHIINLSMGW